MKISKKNLDWLHDGAAKKSTAKPKRKLKSIITVPEEKEQQRIFKWAETAKLTHPELELLNGSMNGVRLTIGQAVKAKKAGMKKGFPDINLPVPKGIYHGLYIELKIKSGGKVSKEQKWWKEKLTEQGYCSVICKGYDDAISVILWYLAGKCIEIV